MKFYNQILLVFLFICCSELNAQATYGSQVVHHFAVDAIDMEALTLDLPPNTFEIKSTNSRRLLMNIIITTNAKSQKAVEYLVKQGRYKVKTKKNANNRLLTINSYIDGDKIFINGSELREDIKYTIFLPAHMHYKPSNSEYSSDLITSSVN